MRHILVCHTLYAASTIHSRYPLISLLSIHSKSNVEQPMSTVIILVSHTSLDAAFSIDSRYLMSALLRVAATVILIKVVPLSLQVQIASCNRPQNIFFAPHHTVQSSRSFDTECLNT